MSDVTEIYERSSTLDDFKKVIHDLACNWRSPPSDAFMNSLACYALKTYGPYKDKFQSALWFCIKNQTTPPAIPDLDEAYGALKRKPLDHIASGSPDTRIVECKICSASGLVLMIHKTSKQEVHGYCICSNGREVMRRGVGCDTAESLSQKGYVSRKKLREMRK